MTSARYPLLYQINTRVWLAELSRSLGRTATLADVPDADLDRLARLGFDWVWFLSVWQTGPEAQAVSRGNAGWRKQFHETLPDLREEDVAGSGFASTGYVTHRGLGLTSRSQLRSETPRATSETPQSASVRNPAGPA